MPVSTAAKLATHLWRGAAQSAANAAHTSASTLRSAFQGGATSGAGSASSGSTASSWTSGLSGGGSGSAGAGAGGAKYHAGRNAQFTYQNSGRALSQASPSGTQDGNNGRNDDDEELRRQKAYQLRLRAQKGSPLRGSSNLPPNLTTAQMQARFKHAFAAKRGPLLIAPAEEAQSTQLSQQSRSYSTQTSGANVDARATLETADANTPAREAADREVDDSTDVADKEPTPADQLYGKLRIALTQRDPHAISDGCAQLLQMPKSERTTALYNVAMEALFEMRGKGMHINDVLDTYSEMLNAGLAPNRRTYALIIRALCQRDINNQTLFQQRVGRVDDGSEEAASVIDAVPELKKLRLEDNFARAVQLFAVAHKGGHSFQSAIPYNALLHCCSYRGHVDEAIQVLDLLERNRNVQTSGTTFQNLIRTFARDPLVKPGESMDAAKSRKLAACMQVFDEFLLSSRNLGWDHSEDSVVWRELLTACFELRDPSAAVGLFERMLASSGKGQQDNLQAPPIDSLTVGFMIRGFLRIGDLPTALDWFSKVVSSDQSGAQLPQPDCATLEELMSALAGRDDLINVLNRVFEVYLQSAILTGWKPRFDFLVALVNANCRAAEAALASDSAQSVAEEYLDKAASFVHGVYTHRAEFMQYGFKPADDPAKSRANVSALLDLSNLLMRMGRIVDAASVFTYTSLFVDGSESSKARSVITPDVRKRLVAAGQAFFAIEDKSLLAQAGVHLLASAEYVAPVLQRTLLLDESFAAGLTSLYRKACEQVDVDSVVNLPVSDAGWTIILDAFCFEEKNLRPIDLQAYKTDGVLRLLEDLARLPLPQEAESSQRTRPNLDVRPALELTLDRYGKEDLSTFYLWSSKAVQATLRRREGVKTEDSPSSVERESGSESVSGASTGATSPSPPRRTQAAHLPGPDIAPGEYQWPPVQIIDTDFGASLLRVAGPKSQQNLRADAEDYYHRIHDELKVGTFSDPRGLAALIPVFGRLGDLAKARELYSMAHHVTANLEADPYWQRAAWFSVEDSMLAAYAHAGDMESASKQRHRIIAIGGHPTVSSYGALIANLHDTTDDASIAQELFEESQRFGLKPNVYLFNTVISKLSRARKADRALQLFEQMTVERRLKPNSVTYGAVINACARIGDEQKAVALFSRMEADPSFKPRVPPFNTMMQFYITTVPNREKALVYYNKMVEAGVAPSAHTYKLLLDLYGSVEPVQPEKMEEVFRQLIADQAIPVQGTHWASLITAYGGPLNDLDKAISTFESIATHPSSKRDNNAGRLPDAVSFEALLAVFVARNRPDLVRTFFARMKDAGIRLTAYVANLLIRSYSSEGAEGLQEARQLFESMIEPVAGVAAPGNHLPRAHGAGAPASPEQQQQQDNQGVAAAPAAVSSPQPFAGVHREPSTYETMIRAEVLHGNRAEAAQLLDRMEARAFPPALLIRAASLIDDLQEPSQAKEQAFSTVPTMHTFAGSSSLTPHSSGLSGASATHHSYQAPAMAGSTAASVRHASTAAGSANAPGTSNPAPGPPKPNSPFTIFDRATKASQKERAALRKLDHDEESSRGAASRQTDYVRHAIAESLADRVADIKRDFPTIVELGAGAGFLRHHLDASMTGTKKIIMCDTSAAMLHRDAHLDASFPFEVERRVVDEESLPFEEGSLDCVVVSGGLHWTNDLPGVLVQIRKALKPDGVFLAGLCGGDTLFELRTSLQLAEQEREGGISPRVSPMADQRDMASLLQRAGFTIPTVDVDEVTVAYPSMFELVADLRDMGESNAVINRRTHLRRDTMLAASAIYESLHPNLPAPPAEEEMEEARQPLNGDGSRTPAPPPPAPTPAPQEMEEVAEGVPATFSLIYLIGWAPAPSQPKPLKRGSAQRSLKDALAGPEGDVQSKVEKEMEEEERRKMFAGFGMSFTEGGGKKGGDEGGSK